MLQRKPMNRGKGFKSPVTDATREALRQESRRRRAAQIAALVAMKDIPDRPRGVIRPVGDSVVAAPKSEPIRSESYRRWVATLPCMACKIEGYSQAAHPCQGRGLGQKASDLDCFPLCCARPGPGVGRQAAHEGPVEAAADQRARRRDQGRNRVRARPGRRVREPARVDHADEPLAGLQPDRVRDGLRHDERRSPERPATAGRAAKAARAAHQATSGARHHLTTFTGAAGAAPSSLPPSFRASAFGPPYFLPQRHLKGKTP